MQTYSRRGTWRSRRLAAALVLLAAAPAAGQGVTLTAEKIRLGAPCVLSTGSGAPSGGAQCDTYWRTDTAQLYIRGASTWAPVGGADLGTANTWTAKQTFNADLDLAGASRANMITLSSGDGYKSSIRFVQTNHADWQFYNPANLSDLRLYSDLATAGDRFIFQNDKSFLPGAGYTGSLGTLGTKWLAAHVAELWAETLVQQNTLALIGGRAVVGSGSALTADVDGSQTYICSKYSLTNGSFLLYQVNGAFEVMKITAIPTNDCTVGTKYTVTRDVDLSGANTWAAGDAIFSLGAAAGDAFMDLYAVNDIAGAGGRTSGYGPTIAGQVRTGTTNWYDYGPRWVVGRLDPHYAYTSTSCGGGPCWGFASGDPSGSWLKIEPTNGVRLGYNTTTKMQITGAGLSMSEANLTINSSGITVGPKTSSGWEDSYAYRFTNAGTDTGGFGLSASVYGPGIKELNLFAVPTYETGETRKGQVLIQGRAEYTSGLYRPWSQLIIGNAGSTAQRSLLQVGDEGSGSPYAASFGLIDGGAAAYHYGTPSLGLLWSIATDGKMTFGSAGDTNLYRLSANRLQTDDAFTAGGGTYGWTHGSVIDVGRIVYNVDCSTCFSFVANTNAYAAMYTAGITANGHAQPYSNNAWDLGGSSARWRDGYFARTVYFAVTNGTAIKPETTGSADLGDGTYYFRHLYFAPDTTTSGDPPLVYSTGNKRPYYRTDTYNTTASGEPVTSITAAYGLVTSVSTTSGISTSTCGFGEFVNGWDATNGILTNLDCATPAPLAAVLERIAALERELAAVRAELAALRAEGARK